MFLSTYENKLDKKGRVSVPASFRSYLSNLGYNGIVCFPSFNHSSIEASMDEWLKDGKQTIPLYPRFDKYDLNEAGTETLPFLSNLFS